MLRWGKRASQTGPGGRGRRGEGAHGAQVRRRGSRNRLKGQGVGQEGERGDRVLKETGGKG